MQSFYGGVVLEIAISGGKIGCLLRQHMAYLYKDCYLSFCGCALSVATAENVGFKDYSGSTHKCRTLCYPVLIWGILTTPGSRYYCFKPVAHECKNVLIFILRIMLTERPLVKRWRKTLCKWRIKALKEYAYTSGKILLHCQCCNTRVKCVKIHMRINYCTHP